MHSVVSFHFFSNTVPNNLILLIDMCTSLLRTIMEREFDVDIKLLRSLETQVLRYC